jgi:predicted ATPase/DNA-binding winged helix-turn-helix (wHTH) protein
MPTASSTTSGRETVTFGPFRLNSTERMLERDGEPVVVGSREMDILIALVERPGEVLPHRELVARAWRGLVVSDVNLRVCITGLRKALRDGHDSARYIVNVPGRGYSFVAPVARHAASQPAMNTAKAPPLPSNLPPRLARIVGRDQVVEMLLELLMQRRFVSIVGTGGLGKTTVAIEVAHACIDGFSGSVYFVDIGGLAGGGLAGGGLPGPDLVVSAVALAVGVVIKSGDPLPDLLRFLSAQRALLVLDSCEPAVDAVAALAERIYEAAPGVHLLTTSREALRAEGEYVHILAPLSVPPAEDLGPEAARRFPAMALFIERAEAAGGALTRTDEEAAVIAGICRRLDGIPLAIELAASQVGTHGLSGTARLLDSRFKLYWQGRRTAMPRHQTLQAMHDWGFNLLCDRDRITLRRLGVFLGPFTLQAAQKVALDPPLSEPEVDEAIASLIQKSLIWTATVGGETYLRLLDTTRECAASKLTEAGESTSVARRQGLYYVALLESAASDRGFLEAVQIPRLAHQINNIRAGLTWSFSTTAELAISVRLAARSAPLFLSLSLLTECRHWCEKGLDALGDDASLSPFRLPLQEALAISAMFTHRNAPDVREAIERGLHLAEQTGQPWHQLNLLTGMHVFLTRIGDYAGSVLIAERSIQVAQSIGDPGSTVVSETMLGAAYHLRGDQARAQRHYDTAVAESAGLQASALDFFGHDHRMRALYGLARVSWLRGAVDQAVLIARRGIAQAESGGSAVNLCIALLYGATVFIWRGDFEEAAGYVERSQSLAARHALNSFHALGLALSGELAALGGMPREGVHLLRKGLAALEAEQHGLLTPTLERALADALFECGDIDDAVATIDGALARASARGETFDMSEILRTQVRIGLGSRRMPADEAERTLLHAIDIARGQSALGFELRSTLALAQLYAASDRVDEARPLLSSVLREFHEGGDTRELRMAHALLSTW